VEDIRMLVLTRRVGEVICIGDNKEIAVKVLRVNGNQVSIGIEAPKEVSIIREELILRDAISKFTGSVTILEI